MNTRHLAFVVLALIVCTGCNARHAGDIDSAAVTQTAIFRAGEGGYDTYRIPALAVTKQGTVLAFCEGRRHSASDAGDIDILLRRSTDHGRTWGPVQVVADDGEATCGNPCPIVDQKTGAIVLLMTKNGRDDVEWKILKGLAPPRTAWVLRSEDDGATWWSPRDISAQVRRPNFGWYATGPGHGLQLRDGRMIVPCNHSEGPNPEDTRSHVIYSDDGGEHWALGGELPGKTDECIAVELPDGCVYLNMRNNLGLKQRAIAISTDRGLTFSPLTQDATLIEPVCQGSALSLSRGKEYFVLFSNPASARRENMTLRLSRDAAKTWATSLVLFPGPAAYSDLANLADGEIGCLYERGDSKPYEMITFARVPWRDLSGK